MKRFITKLSFVAVVAMLSCALATPVMAVSFTHTGQADPTTEGWTYGGDDVGLSGGNDGTDYWEISAYSAGYYTVNGLTDTVATSIIDSTNGWTIEATVKVTTPLAEINTAVMSIMDNLGDPSADDDPNTGRGAWGDLWAMTLMTDPLGDPNKTGVWTQRMATGDDAVFLAAVDITAYHTYKMVMTRGATLQQDSVEFFVDDTPIATVARTDAYNMQYWRDYVPDGWSKFSWGRTATGDPNLCVSQWADVEFSENVIDTPIPGDANGDKKVDGSDVTILAGNWQKGVSDGLTATWAEGDFNDDGKVDGSDVTILAGNWQTGVTATSAAVPEPGTILLLLSAVASLLVWRRFK